MQKAEFPDNGPSDFKAQLPKDRLWREDDGWEVGLSGVSLPTIPPPPPPPQKVQLEPAIQSTTSPWAAVNFKKTADLDKVYLEPAIWSRDTGQRIPCF